MEVCNRDSNTLERNEPQSSLVHRKVDNLDDLIKQLHCAFATDFVDIDHVRSLMEAYRSSPQDWKKYTRNLVDDGNGRFNLIVLCWGEGHGSAIHDHANAHCVMKVLQGELTETRYAWPDESAEPREDGDKLQETSRSTFGLNDVCYINDSLGLHRIENPSTINPAVSLHIYSPPFDMCSVFNKQTGQKIPCKVTFWSKHGERRNREIQDSRSPEDN
ncbi:cysteine dioxygenase type 1 isoform X2 [Venturia canescens]|uniref:cysteine dioxygenase type 1 isoform X2 n=1 Tax=Venturia canescens TaxID=32260 RepID=UPI001C9D10A1|nr:cysteine dioxygenase type 1 isoform X2 [Venturia canescens]